jgi:diadenosine tetraphosphate (Ap4A) HIT family hydrolase
MKSGIYYNNPFSSYTAKERDRLSSPARLLINHGLIVGKVLDFGCGYGTDVNYLKEMGIDIIGYDKYHKPDYPETTFDTIICLYVLNVLFPEEQSEVLMQISTLLKPNGKAYIAVRRDITIEGFRQHKKHKVATFQCNVVLNFRSIYKNDSYEIYEYVHYNQRKENEISSCPFCAPNEKMELISESAICYSIFDNFPVNQGHALIIPKRHISNYFELNRKEQYALILMMGFVKTRIEKMYNPDGFNIGINVGKSAGQTIDHVHIHVIPRYNGDVSDPSGGIRCVIPGKQKYF